MMFYGLQGIDFVLYFFFLMVYPNLKRMEEEPNRNFFGLRYVIPEHLNAVWELMRGMAMGYIYGPDYKEGWFGLLARVLGLGLPGISAHCPTNYINSIRLGKESSI